MIMPFGYNLVAMFIAGIIAQHSLYDHVEYATCLGAATKKWVGIGTNNQITGRKRKKKKKKKNKGKMVIISFGAPSL